MSIDKYRFKRNRKKNKIKLDSDHYQAILLVFTFNIMRKERKKGNYREPVD